MGKNPSFSKTPKSLLLLGGSTYVAIWISAGNVCVKVIHVIATTYQNIRRVVWSVNRQYTQNRYEFVFIIVLRVYAK